MLLTNIQQQDKEMHNVITCVIVNMQDTQVYLNMGVLQLAFTKCKFKFSAKLGEDFYHGKVYIGTWEMCQKVLASGAPSPSPNGGFAVLPHTNRISQ